MSLSDEQDEPAGSETADSEVRAAEQAETANGDEESSAPFADDSTSALGEEPETPGAVLAEGPSSQESQAQESDAQEPAQQERAAEEDAQGPEEGSAETVAEPVPAPAPTQPDEAVTEDVTAGGEDTAEETEALPAAEPQEPESAPGASEATEATAGSEPGPVTEPFGPDEASDHASGGKADPEEQDGAARTEAMPAPVAGAVAFPAPPPDEEDAGPAASTAEQDFGTEGEEDDGSAAQDTQATASLWPAPQRLSDYVSDRPETELRSDRDTDGSSDGVSGAGSAGAAGAVGPAGAASASAGPEPQHTPPGSPGSPEAPGSAQGEQQSSAQHGASGHGGSQGPGGPKGPPGGPGGPKGPGDKDGKKGKRKKPLWRRVLGGLLVAAVLFIIAGGVAFAYLYATVEVPDAAKADAVEQGSTFYFADGETEFAYRGTDREVIDYEEMVAGGDHVVEAVISAEDRGFWTEPGVSLSGTARAVWSTVTGEQVQGGSTVTQQMVRNYYEGVSLEQTVSRKIQEIIISIKVDQSEDKEWVMEQYLNTIYFGRMSYGVQAAAQAYYHKDVDEITPEEAAFLAAAIQQPTHFGQADVETTPAMENRWQYVVDGMVTTGAISQSEADAMEFPAPEPDRPQAGADISGYKGYMLQEALSELAELGFNEDHINRQGFTVVTTFDKDMMDAAYEAVEEMVPPEDLPEGVNIGLTTIDPSTGEVLAFYGGHDYLQNQYDSSFLGAAQAGSAFKPYVLATALEQGYGLNSTVDGRGPREIQGSRVQNAGNAPGGVMTLTQATTVSNNLGFIELAQEVGFEQIRDTAYDTGLPEGSIADNQLVPVMPLGATSVRPVDQASGYATFANGGVHMRAHVIKEVVNQEGENERPEIEGERALKESTAADVTYALEQVVNSGTGTAARLWDHPVAGKTGTTDGSVAAWFVGYTPQLSTAVAVYSGNNEGFSIPGHNISGGGLPASMWNSYMSRAMEGYERESFPGPEFGGTTENWAPDPATQQPQEPQQPADTPEPVAPPEETLDPEPPAVPEPVDPVPPAPPEDPGGPGDPEEPGEPEVPPPSRNGEDG